MKIKTETNKIGEIFGNIRRHGKLIQESKTSYGADVWELDGITARLEDDGATWCLQSNDLIVRSTLGGTPLYYKGGSKQLDQLYTSLFGIDEK